MQSPDTQPGMQAAAARPAPVEARIGARARVRGWVAKAALAAASIIALLAVMEAASRVYARRALEGSPGTVGRPSAVFDPELGWVKPPGVTVVVQRPEFRITETINAHGLRGPFRPHAKAPGVRRVLLLGDSFTEAATVEEAETLRAVAEQRLQEIHGRPHEVINAGTAGYSTDQEYLFYLRDGTRYQADVVVVVFYFNDLHGVVVREADKPRFELREGALLLRNSPVPAPPPGWARGRSQRFVLRPWRRSYGLRLLSSRTAAGNPELHRVLARTGIVEPFDDSGPPPEMWPFGRSHQAEVSEMWERVTALLAALRARVQSDGGRLVLLYAPAAFECDRRAWDLTRRRYRLGPRWDPGRVAAELTARAADLGIPLVDPRPELRAAHAAGARPYYARDGHWTAQGNRVVAEVLAGALARP